MQYTSEQICVTRNLTSNTVWTFLLGKLLLPWIFALIVCCRCELKYVCIVYASALRRPEKEANWVCIASLEMNHKQRHRLKSEQMALLPFLLYKLK